MIQIFTKRGRSGAPRFSAQGDWSGITVPTNRIDTIAEIQGRMQSRFGISPGAFEDFQQDIVPESFTTGFNQTYSASVTGGTDAFQYFVSGRYASEDGPYDIAQNFPEDPNLEPENDTNRRAGFTSNFTVIPNQKIRIGISTLYSDMEHHTPDNGNNIYGAFSSMLMTQLRMATDQAEPGTSGSNYYGNPAFATTRENMYQQNFVNSSHFAGSGNIGFTPTDNFRLDGTFGLDFTSDDAVAFRPYAWNVDGFSGSTPDGNRNVEEYNQRAGGSGDTFPGPGLETLSALANDGTFESWTRVTQLGGYLQDQVGINDWVFVTVGGRWDANSAFGEDFSTVFYPKVSASLVPSQGLGWQSETFSTFRVRGALGQSGLQPDAFAKFTTYQPRPSEAGPGVGPDNLGNDALQPEVSTEWEVGAELGLFNDRWSVDATYWDRTVSDAMVSRQFSVTGGFTEEQLVNIGELVGSGYEVSVRGNLLQREGLSLNLFANGAYLKEEITSMGGAPPLKAGGSYPRYRNFLVEGYTPGAFFGSQTADLAIPLNILDPAADGSCIVPSEAEALAYFATPRSPSDFKPLAIANSDFGTPISGEYASNNCGSGLLDTYLGKPTPDWAGSFGFNMAFATNFELNTLFEYKSGIQNQDLSGMFRRSNPVIGRNTPRSAELGSIMADPASSAEQRLDAAVAWANEVEGLAPMSGMNGVYDASLIRFRELSLTYRLPADLVSGWGLTTATVNLGARNLHMWIWGDYPGMDPETNVIGRCNSGLSCNFLNSTEGWSIPIPRRFTLSTRITF